MPKIQHTDDGETLLKELERLLNVTGPFIQQRTIFGDLIEFWKTQTDKLLPLNFSGQAPVEFNTEWLTFAEGTRARLIELLYEIRWEFAGAKGLDNCVARLFQFTLPPAVKALAWDHLRRYITTRHFKGTGRIGLSLPTATFQSLRGHHREDAARALSELVEEIVRKAKANGTRTAHEVLVAAMDKAVKSFGPAKPAGDTVFCIFDVSQKTKTVLEQAVGDHKFSDRVAALILQKLHKDELPGFKDAQ